MKWKLLVFTVLPLLLGGAAQPSDQTLPATVSASAADVSDRYPEVERLIAQLASDQWPVRQAAQQALADRGEPVRQRLMELIRETDNEEVRSGAEVALAHLAEAESSGVTLLTLHMKAAPARRVFDEISRQAQASFQTSLPGLWVQQTAPLDIDVDNQPFWVVMRNVCQRTGLTLQDRGGMYLSPLPGNDRQVMGKAPFVINGPYMIVITGIHQSRFLNLDRPGPKASTTCVLDLLVCVEPKIHVLQSQIRPSVQVLVDENGQSLVGGQESALSGAGSLAGHWSYYQRIDLVRPPGSGKRIARLKGNSRFNIQMRSTPPQPQLVNVSFEFKDIPLP